MLLLSPSAPSVRPLRPALLCLACAGLAACAGWEREPVEANDDDTPRGLRVSQGYLAGQVGPLADLDHPTDAHATGRGDVVDVTLTARTEAGAAMAVLTLEGPLSFPQLADGESITVFDTRGRSAPGVHASVLGCAGPQVGQWQYDRTASSVTVVVEPKPGAPGWHTWSFVATLPYGSRGATVISGSFDLELEPELARP